MAAKKDETVSMFDSFKEFKETKNIDRTTLVSVLEESFRNVLAKIFGSDENFDVIVNPDKGDFEIYRNRVVVADGEVEDENKQISLKEARKIEADYEVGEDVSEKVNSPSSDAVPSLTSVRLSHPRFLNWSTTRSTTSTRTAWDRLSQPRFIRCGSVRCS